MRIPRPAVAAATCCLLLVGCGSGARDEPAPASARAAAGAAGGERARGTGAPRAAEREALVVVLGDSLAAGYGVAESEAFPARLQALLRAEGVGVRVLNAGVSGDTTAGGLERLDWMLRQRPDVVVLELGANDGLRGLPVERTEANLRELVVRSRAAGSRVLLVGMRVPTNMGTEYGDAFAAVFPRVAADAGVPLVPFLLEGVALVPELNLADGIHPTAAGHARLAETVLPHLRPLLPPPSAPE